MRRDQTKPRHDPSSLIAVVVLFRFKDIGKERQINQSRFKSLNTDAHAVRVMCHKLYLPLSESHSCRTNHRYSQLIRQHLDEKCLDTEGRRQHFGFLNIFFGHNSYQNHIKASHPLWLFILPTSSSGALIILRLIGDRKRSNIRKKNTILHSLFYCKIDY